MKKLLIVMMAVFTASVMFYSCSDDFSSEKGDERSISFISSEQTIGGVGYKVEKQELVDIQVEIKVVDGEPKIISDAVEERVLMTEDGPVTMFVYKGDSYDEVNYRKPMVNTIGYIHSGYLFNHSSGCFVHCNYLQGDNGVVMAISCCVNPGDCTGLDPVCPAIDELFG